MHEAQSAAEFNRLFRQRVQRVRIQSDHTQKEVARRIGVAEETYKKYETRSVMPVYLIPRFANAVGCDIAYLFTGQGESRMRDVRRRGPRLTAADKLSG